MITSILLCQILNRDTDIVGNTLICTCFDTEDALCPASVLRRYMYLTADRTDAFRWFSPTVFSISYP